MAVGDLTRDTGSPTIEGNHKVLEGTLEANYVRTAFALLDTKSYIVSCQLTCVDGVGTAQVQLNKNASGTTTNGTIAVFADHKDAATYRYRVTYV